MRAVILDKLAEIEVEYNVKILYSCESGSRAWGFASPDSDYDVRFIYASDINSYLSLNVSKDTIDLPVNPVLDINGWDLKKSLTLLTKSNGPLYEWLQSPIIYKETGSFKTRLMEHMPSYFSLIAGFHHYFSMAKNVFENDLRGSLVKLKKYFYVLRPLLACRWIIEKQTVPPMELSKLRIVERSRTINDLIDELLRKKEVSDEKATIAVIPELNQWVVSCMEYCFAKSNTLPALKYDIKPLNQFFINCLKDDI